MAHPSPSRLPLTHHARSRLQQRGIPAMALEPILEYGREEHDHHGGAILYLDHRARERVRRQVGAETYRRLEPHLDAYIVLAEDGSIITVGHRTRRIRHH